MSLSNHFYERVKVSASHFYKWVLNARQGNLEKTIVETIRPSYKILAGCATVLNNIANCLWQNQRFK